MMSEKDDALQMVIERYSEKTLADLRAVDPKAKLVLIAVSGNAILFQSSHYGEAMSDIVSRCAADLKRRAP